MSAALTLGGALPRGLRDQLGGLRSSFREAGDGVADIEVVGGADWPAAVAAASSRAVLLLDPVRVSAATAEAAIGQAHRRGAIVAIGGAWISSPARQIDEDLLSRLGAPVLVDIRRRVADEVQESQRELGIDLILDELDLRPRRQRAEVERGALRVRMGRIGRDDDAIPYRERVQLDANSPSELALRVLYETGQLDILLPAGSDATPGEVTVGSPSGRTVLPTSYVSPYRRALLRLAGRLAGGPGADDGAADVDALLRVLNASAA